MVNEFLSSLKKVAVEVHSFDGLKEKLESGRKLVIKLGADPSRPDLHLGHTVVLRQLRKFQQLGHEVVFVVGDFTAMIGDPTGKSKTRPSLSFEQTRKSGQTYFEQVTKILDKEKTRVVYNSDWLSKMNFELILKLAGKYTLARLLERDDFASRYKNNTPIGIHELFYPLMQGYDSVALHADVEIGGTDQTFNLLVGRELQKDYGQTPQEVITFPLLVGLDGKEKMSKSLDNYIGISEPSDVMFEKCMKIPDEVLSDFYRLTSDIQNYDEIIKKDIREAHFVYARWVVKEYHDEESAIAAEKRYLEVAKGALPTDVKVIEVKEKEVSIVSMLTLSNLCQSNSQARQLIKGNGVKINNEIISDFNAMINVKNGVTLSKGKNNFVKFLQGK